MHVPYLHGGAYRHPPETEHWESGGALAAERGATVTQPLYPLEQSIPEGRRATRQIVDILRS